MDEAALRYATEGLQVEVMDFLLAEGCPFDMQGCMYKVFCSRAPASLIQNARRWLGEHGCDWDAYVAHRSPEFPEQVAPVEV